MLSLGIPNTPSAIPVGYTPAQIRAAYGFDNASGINQIQFNGVPGDGRGQTIAIVDPYDDPNIGSDLKAFDRQFGLSDPVLTKVSETGTTSYPAANTVTATQDEHGCGMGSRHRARGQHPARRGE